LLKGKTIAVTGSSGFVGRHLVKRIRETRADILELDITNGTDVSDWKQIKCIDKIDILFHLAAKTFVPESFEHPREFYQININSTLNALELCRIHQAKMIFASSYIYGQPRYLPVDEKHPLIAHNPYAQSKIICEQLSRSYYHDFGVKVIILRPFNIYGPGQNDRFLIPSIIAQAKKGMVSLKDPSPRRDFVYISDAIDAYLKAATYNKKDFDIFNIGFGESYSVREIVSKVTSQYDHELKIIFSDEKRKNEIMDTVADITKAREVLNWKPKTDFISGIKQTVYPA